VRGAHYLSVTGAPLPAGRREARPNSGSFDNAMVENVTGPSGRNAARWGIVALLGLAALSCDSPTGTDNDRTRLEWVLAPPTILREGAATPISVELRDSHGVPLLTMDGTAVTLRLEFAADSLPGFSCANECATVLTRGRAELALAWISAGAWDATACARPAAPADSVCVKASITVLPVQAVLTVFPADSVGRRVRFPVEARLRLPDGTPVVDMVRPVRLRIASVASDAGHVTCPLAGPLCERETIDGVARLDSVTVLDLESTTLSACAVAPNGHERCDPAGPRTFKTFVPAIELALAAAPSAASVGVPFTPLLIVNALEPDGTRRSSFNGLVSLTLGAGAQLGPVLAGTGVDAAPERGTVTVRAMSGAATFTDLRIIRVHDAYSLVATSPGTLPDTSAPFAVTMEGSQLTLVKVAGDEQYGLVASPLPVAPAVHLTGPLGDDIEGAEVAFRIIGREFPGNGTLGAGVLMRSDTTDGSGIASSGPWTMGPDVWDPLTTPYSEQDLNASVLGLGTAAFHAMAIIPMSGVLTTGPSDLVVGDTLRPAVAVEVRDFLGRRVTAYADSVIVRTRRLPRPTQVGDPPPDLTDDLLGTKRRRAIEGVATFDDLSLERADSMVLLVAGRTDSVSWLEPWNPSYAPRRLLMDAAPFTAFARMSTVRLSRHLGEGQSALVGTAVANAPAVRVADQYGNGIAGRTVTFAVAAGGGTVSDSVQATDVDGVAQLGAWTLGLDPGANALTVTANGLIDTVVFSAVATGEVIAFEQLAFVVPPSDLIAGDTMSPAVVIELQDLSGRRAFGATDSIFVSARLGGGGYLLGTTVVAAVDGRATFPLLTLTKAGTFTFHAQDALVAGPGARAVSAGFVVSAAAPATMLVVAGLNATGTAGRDIAEIPTVRVDDIHANPVPGVPVHFAVTLGGGTVTDPDRTTDADGRARPTAWRLGDAPGYNALTAYTPGLDSVTVLVLADPPTFDSDVVSAGDDFSCAVERTSGLPYCWGENGYGQLGDGTQVARNRPTLIGGGLLTFTRISAGTRFACGLATTGAAYCWGDNTFGQLGRGNADSALAPVAVLGGHTFTQVAVGGSHACALDTTGIVWCWGTDGWGQLGNGQSPASDQYEPVQVNTAVRFTQVTVGGFHSCGISTAGAALCWGYNVDGRSGDGTTTSYLYSPTLVAGGLTFTHLSGGAAHTCGIATGSVYCWGRNNEAQLGTGAASTTPSRSPTNTLGALGTSVRIAAGGSHSCAVNSAGEVYCWGTNTRGQLGDLSTTLRPSGVLIAGSSRFATITAAADHTCGTRLDGATFCWGWNYLGRLGVGAFNGLNYPFPSQVVVP